MPSRGYVEHFFGCEGALVMSYVLSCGAQKLGSCVVGVLGFRI